MGIDMRWVRLGGIVVRRVLDCLAICLLVGMFWLLPGSGGAHAQLASKAEAAPPPFRIAVFASSDHEKCYDPGLVRAITAMGKAEEERINKDGGISGRRVQVVVYDDARDEGRAIANVRAALGDPDTLAMIGLQGSNRAKAVFDALGAEIGKRGIPFLSSISVNQVFARYPNVFTTQPTQDDERVPVMAASIRRLGFQRPAFVGAAEFLFSNALGDGLRKVMTDRPLVSDQRLNGKGGELQPDELRRVVGGLGEVAPDVIVLGMGGERAGAFLSALMAVGTTPAVFVGGRIETIPEEITGKYPNAIYQLAWDRLPEADSDRLRSMMARDAPENWVFEGGKVPAAPGWAAGKCKPREATGQPDPLSSANMRAVGVGAITADMIALVATVSSGARGGGGIGALRRRIVAEIPATYAAGRGAFKGRFDNWSFNPLTRAATRTPFVVILPRGLGRTQLAPVQFVRLRDGSLRPIETLYLDVDLIRSHHVEDNEKTFFAEFYLSMRRGATTSIDALDFTNAYIDPRTNGRQITIERLHDGAASNVYPDAMMVYKVSGRFVFEPDLGSYPFDTQRFSIEIQPKRGDAPFIVQPPPTLLRDKTVVTDGWEPRVQYVGYDEDFIPLIDAYTLEPSVVPFYKASFVWMMKRETTDYYFRVVVPLAFILVVAYLSIFIPISHFEAIVTIQVTALLSAVALYLALPKLDSDTATVSDRIFVFNYMLLSVMIVISIMRVTRVVAGRRWLRGLLWATHVIVMPLLVASVAWLVYQTGNGGADGLAAHFERALDGVVHWVRSFV